MGKFRLESVDLRVEVYVAVDILTRRRIVALPQEVYLRLLVLEVLSQDATSL